VEAEGRPIAKNQAFSDNFVDFFVSTCYDLTGDLQTGRFKLGRLASLEETVCAATGEFGGFFSPIAANCGNIHKSEETRKP